MKIGLIGATGRLGGLIVDKANGIEIKAFVRNPHYSHEHVEVVNKSLFDITKEDIDDIDVLISAFGSGFSVEPTINYEAFLKYIELLNHTNKKLIVIGGAGLLYQDDTQTLHEYESEGHPEKLKAISHQICLGVEALKKETSFDWTVVCPSRFFDYEHQSQSYMIDESEQIVYNQEGKSYSTYSDVADVMLKLTSESRYNHQVITVLSTGGMSNEFSR